MCADCRKGSIAWPEVKLIRFDIKTKEKQNCCGKLSAWNSLKHIKINSWGLLRLCRTLRVNLPLISTWYLSHLQHKLHLWLLILTCLDGHFQWSWKMQMKQLLWGGASVCVKPETGNNHSQIVCKQVTLSTSKTWKKTHHCLFWATKMGSHWNILHSVIHLLNPANSQPCRKYYYISAASRCRCMCSQRLSIIYISSFFQGEEV